MKKNIMIKSAIAAAIAAATTATTIADTKLYGRFRAAAICNDLGTVRATQRIQGPATLDPDGTITAGTVINTGDIIRPAGTDCGLENQDSRFGIKASHEISDGLTAFGRYEFGVNLDEGALSNNTTTNRLAYVGLKGGFGEVSIGARWSPLYLFTVSPVDPTQAFGGTWSTGIGTITDFRNTDTVNYRNNFGAANVHVQLQLDDDNAANDIDEWQIGAGYKAGPVNLAVAYADQADVGNVVGLHGNTKLGQFGVGLSYFIASTDAGVNQIYGKSEGDAVLGQLQYALGGGKAVTLHYGQDFPDVGAAKPSMVAVEYEHRLSKNFRWFAGVENNDFDGAVGTNTNLPNLLRYGVGMRLEF